MFKDLRLGLVIAFCLFCSSCRAGDSPAAQVQAPARLADAQLELPREINLLAMADWGMLNQRQRAVAATIANHVRSSDKEYAAMLTGGDNIYVQPKSADDPIWDQVFEQMYDPRVLNFPFYVTPGNHDYEHGKIPIELAYARQNPNSRWKFPSTYYRLDFPEGADNSAQRPLVTVLMLDSCKDQMGSRNWEAQTEWLREQLQNPRNGTWLFCVAHHPLYSNGDHGDNGVLQRTWGTLFAQHAVDMYICGHDHDLQHLELPGVQTSFILVGGGGATTRPMRIDRRGPFSKSTYGFADLNITPTTVTVKFIGPDGKVLHAFERTKSGDVEVLKPGQRDPAKPRTARTINQPDQPATTRSTTRPTTTETPASATTQTLNPKD